MNIPFVDLKNQYFNIKDEVDEAIEQVLVSSNYIGGSQVATFEQQFAKLSGFEYCVGVANGTDALTLSLQSLEIGLGDEVITTACSWFSSAECVFQVGATPIFVDISDDYLIDIGKLESKINEKTKAILPVHLYGQMANMKSIKRLCEKHNLFLIEDCAQSVLAKRDGLKAGQVSNVAAFSFYPGKNLGAYGDAGAICTNDQLLADRVRRLGNYGSLYKHEHLIHGTNSRLDTIQAAILNVKLGYLQQWTEQRKKIAERYLNNLSDEKKITLPIICDTSEHVFHLFVIRANRRDELQKCLLEKGIETAIHYPQPLPFIHCFKSLKIQKTDFPKSQKLAKEILSLPMYPELSYEDIDYVCDQIKRFYSKKIR